MYKSVYDANKEAAQQRLNDAGREYRNAKRKSEIAAVTDFATNLVALIGRNKGVRYNVGGKNISSGAMEKFEDAQKRYHRALVDYKGIIAADSLKNKVPATTPQGSISSLPALKYLTPTSYIPPQQTKPWEQRTILDKIKNIKTPQWYSNYKNRYDGKQ